MNKIIKKPSSDVNKRIAIVGGGISGLMTGLRALKEKYSVTIYEKNKILGGAFNDSLTYGYANNYILIGTSYDAVRKNLNKITDFSFLFPKDTDYIYIYRGKEEIYFYQDLNKFKTELNKIAPLDINVIDDFTQGIKDASKLDYKLDNEKKFYLFDKDCRQMTFFFNKYGKKTIEEYCSNIKNEDFKKALINFINPKNSISLIMLIMGLYISKRLTMVNNPNTILEKLKDEFLGNGGEIKLNSEVKKITSKGTKIIVTYGSEDLDESYDDVIYACDCYNLFDSLIPKKYLSSKGKLIYNNSLESNMMSAFVCTYNINSNYNELVKFANQGYFSCKLDKKFRVGCKNNEEFKIFIRDNKLTIIFNQSDDDYEFFKLISKNSLTYKKEINRITNDIEEILIKHLGIGKFNLEKVLTPVDFSKTFNQHKGGVNGLVLSPNAIGANMENEVKGFKNLYISSAGLYRPFWFYSSAIASNKAIELIKDNDMKRG